MIGVNFQPGAQDYSQNGDGRPSSGSGVQEAIRILSLRLPRVLGAQSAAALPLLTSAGGGGNPRVDSVVNQVMSRFGQMPPMQPQRPSEASGPNFSGDASVPYGQSQPMPMPWGEGPVPRVIIGNPPWWGTDADIRPPGSGPGTPPGMFGQLPPGFTPPEPPPLPNFDQPIFNPRPFEPQPAYEPDFGQPFI